MTFGCFQKSNPSCRESGCTLTAFRTIFKTMWKQTAQWARTAVVGVNDTLFTGVEMHLYERDRIEGWTKGNTYLSLRNSSEFFKIRRGWFDPHVCVARGRGERDSQCDWSGPRAVDRPQDLKLSSLPQACLKMASDSSLSSVPQPPPPKTETKKGHNGSKRGQVSLCISWRHFNMTQFTDTLPARSNPSHSAPGPGLTHTAATQRYSCGSAEPDHPGAGTSFRPTSLATGCRASGCLSNGYLGVKKHLWIQYSRL